jgi:hypothetical protein
VIERIDLGIDPLTGVRKYEVRDASTGEVIGYDYVAPESEPS